MRVQFRDDLATGRVLDFLAGPRLWVPESSYPDYGDWLAKIEPELSGGSKRHLACVWNGELCGVVVWQRHKTNREWVEVKNLTVRPAQRGRMVGSFLLRQAEVEGQHELGATFVICDAKQSSPEIVAFLLSAEYRVLGVTDIYRLGAGNDVVLGRSLENLRAHAAG